MLRVLIVDDEPLARENLRVLLQEQPDIEIVGECANAIEAIGAVHKLRPDVLFLDIQMPRISGLEMVGMLDHVMRWRSALRRSVVQAVDEGHLRGDTDVDQLVFELDGLFIALMREARFLRDPRAAERSWAAYERLMRSHTAEKA